MSLNKEEKKVEYIELIYDLIFVYIIGRNNSLLHYVDNGFVPGRVFLGYVMCTLAAIQIWNFTTFYINIYGRNSVRDHVFLFINMYLLYYIADGTSVYWQALVYRYSLAWALILLNIGVQHIIELRHHKNAPWELKQLRRKAAVILSEAVLVLLHLLIYSKTGIVLSYIPIAFGIVATVLSGKINALVPVDFAHLTERAMLYVVFTFGEMIISVASYFGDTITINTVYFSVMAFLIVAGLFSSYGTLYNSIIDREMTTNGTFYMMIHVFLIFALNNISVALEFMREEEVALLPKTLFLVGSFIIYFVFLFSTEIYSKKICALNKRFYLILSIGAASFILLMLLLRNFMYLNIAVTVIYVFAVFMVLFFQSKSIKES